MSKSTIGLRDLVTAQLLTDAASSPTTYGPVEAVIGSINVKITDDSGKADVQYADDAEFDRLYPLPKLGFSMQLTDVPPLWQAKFFGHATDANGVVVAANNDVPPYRAFGYKSKKADGSFRYVWLLKCIPVKRSGEHEHATEEGDKVDRKTSTIDWEVVPTIYAGKYQYFVDDDTAAFSSAKATFFDAPYNPAAAGDIQITTQPLDKYLAKNAGGSLVVLGTQTPAYQWYKAAGKTYAGAEQSDYTGNKGGTLTIPTSIASGTHYFFAKASKAGFRDVYSEIAVVIIGE